MEELNNNSADNNKNISRFINKTTICVLLISLSLSIILMFVVYPFFGYSKAKKYYEQGRYDLCVERLNVLSLNPVVNSLRNKAEEKLKQETIDDIFAASGQFKGMTLVNSKIEGVYADEDNSLIQIKMDFSNGYYSVDVTGNVLYEVKDGKLVYDGYSVVDKSYVIKAECSKEYVNRLVNEEYPKAEFLREGNSEQQFKEFIYSYTKNDADPFYYSNYELNAIVVYDFNNNAWKIKEIRKDEKSRTEIPFKEFRTAAFTISMPEEWILIKYERENYDYSYLNGVSEKKLNGYELDYTVFQNREAIGDQKAFVETKNGPVGEVMSIYTYPFSQYSTEINGGDYRNKAFGTGKFSDHSLSFTPTIRGMKYNMTVYFDNSIDHEDIERIFDTAILKNNTFPMTVKTNNLRVRSSPDTWSRDNIVGHLKEGDKVEAKLMIEEAWDGLYWYNIGDERWVGNQDGEFLDIQYD